MSQTAHREDVPEQIARPRFGRIDAGLDQVEEAVERSKEHIFSQQHPEGFWVGELEADASLEADYIFAHVLLGTGDPGKMERALTDRLVQALLALSCFGLKEKDPEEGSAPDPRRNSILSNGQLGN